MILVDFWQHSDAFSLFLALVLLALSVASWVVIFWKWRLLRRVQADVPRSIAAFWQAPHLAAAREQLPAFDRDRSLLPLVEATEQPLIGTLAGAGLRHEQLTRTLRHALHGVLRRLQWGQTVLATAGAIAPFVGLLGTVWGIFNALTGMAEAGQLTVDKIAGPVGEALIMTAAGLAVALPAVFAYNAFTRANRVVLADLDAFAHDLHAFFTVGKPFVANSAQIHPMRARAAAEVA